MKKLLAYTTAIFLAVTSIISCKDDEGGGIKGVNFDQAAMLQNYGSNLILPGYADLNTKAATLEQAVDAFAQNPTVATLTAAQNALQQARLSWQRVSMFEFGPAAEVQLRNNINTFPSIRSQIEASIQNGSWDFNRLYAEDEKGFPALDYLLWGETGQAADVLAGYTTDANAVSRQNYIKAVAQEISTLAEGVYNEWSPSGGNYLGTFNTNTGNGAGNSLSLLVNNMVFDYEIIKNQKLRNPLGLMSVNEQPTPRNLEAYYSGQSLQLLKANLEGFESVYRGSFGTGDGPGLEEYLVAHYEAGNTEQNFAEAINEGITAAKEAINAVPAPLREAVVSSREVAVNAYNKLQALVPVIKVNLPNTLGVSITYTDTDGD